VTNTFDLESEIELAYNWAKEMLEDTGEFMPSFIAWPKDEEGRMLFTTPWSDEQSKEEMVRLIKMIFMVYNIERYMLVSEVWTVEAKDKCKLLPSERDDKKECLGITYVDETQSKMFAWPIIRNGAGKPSLGEKISYDKGAGRMSELLPPIDCPVCPKEAREHMIRVIQEQAGLKLHKLEDLAPNKETWL